MKIQDKVIHYLKEELIEIELRTDITDDQKISRIIRLFSAVCAGVAVQPIPFADIFILTPIQAFMGTRIAAIRGVPVSDSDAVTIIKEISGVVGLGFLGQQLAIGAYKTVLPFWGAITTIPLVFGLTYGIGRVMDVYMVSKARGQILDPNELRKVWKEGRKEGKKSSDVKGAKNHRDNIKKQYVKPTIEYVKTNLDELAIVTALMTIRDGEDLDDTDAAVLASFQRYSDQTRNLEDTKEYLQDLSDEQINGVVSGVKGILHEMEFVRIENEDGDPITATLFTNTNHPGFDVVLTNSESGEIREVQLKSTDNESYVQDWIDEHPNGEILVTKEIADEMDLRSSGFSNEEITTKVENFIDRLIDDNGTSALWGFIPGLSLLSVATIVYELHGRYKSGRISLDEFKSYAVKATGLKLAKITLMVAFLSLPGINVVVGTALVAKLILTAFDWKSDKSSIYDTPKLSKERLLQPYAPGEHLTS